MIVRTRPEAPPVRADPQADEGWAPRSSGDLEDSFSEGEQGGVLGSSGWRWQACAPQSLELEVVAESPSRASLPPGRWGVVPGWVGSGSHFPSL